MDWLLPDNLVDWAQVAAGAGLSLLAVVVAFGAIRTANVISRWSVALSGA
jgi:hypothetical protein